MTARNGKTKLPNDLILLEVGKVSELREREAQPVAEVGGTPLLNDGRGREGPHRLLLYQGDKHFPARLKQNYLGMSVQAVDLNSVVIQHKRDSVRSPVPTLELRDKGLLTGAHGGHSQDWRA